MSERNLNGQFVQGNSGGPGRPRRTVEREYMAALGETVTLDDWRAICQKAAGDAKLGDPRARDWLSRHLLGAEPPSLMNLAIAEASQTVDDIVAEQADQRRRQNEMINSMRPVHRTGGR